MHHTLGELDMRMSLYSHQEQTTGIWMFDIAGKFHTNKHHAKLLLN